MKVLVTGSRGWHDEERIYEDLLMYRTEALAVGEEFVVIHGHARSGADKLADIVCRERLGFTPIRVPAQWDRYGKAAGFRRNQQMLDEHPDIDLVLAYRAHGKSNGCDDMVRRANKANVTVVMHTPAVQTT